MVATIFGGLASTKSRRERKLAARRVLAVASEETTAESKRDQKLTARRVLAINVEAAVANPNYCPWSEVPITFSRADRWADIPYIGRFPLVLDATI